MPHIAVKIFPGRSEQQKHEFAAKVIEAAKSVFGSSDTSLSLAILDVAPEEWDVEVYGPEIQANEDKLYKRPGYGSLAIPSE
ncbi:4-oxalocrotonate tautomerase [Rhizobium sp. BK251]|nr:4-oxalocrotonate tautomerase [Rhizobium sp. BK251]